MEEAQCDSLQSHMQHAKALNPERICEFRRAGYGKLLLRDFQMSTVPFGRSRNDILSILVILRFRILLSWNQMSISNIIRRVEMLGRQRESALA